MNTPCDHGWHLPPGMECPECIFDAASSDHNSTMRKNCDKVTRAVELAASLMPTQAEATYVLKVAANENRWKALQVARKIRQKHFAK